MANRPPTLTITVSPEGEISTDFSHFLGQHCLVAGKHLHGLLAEYGIEMDITTFTPKPELLSAPSSGELRVQETEVLHEGH
jgi:hypothetical protein